MLIEPDGQMQLLGTYDKIALRPQVNGGCIYPQSVLPSFDAEAMAEMLARSLYKEQGIFGFVSVDFLTFKDPKFPQ
jgi:hypothetical protein